MTTKMCQTSKLASGYEPVKYKNKLIDDHLIFLFHQSILKKKKIFFFNKEKRGFPKLWKSKFLNVSHIGESLSV